MTSTKKDWYVLTGGPCAGKTTTIMELEKRGNKIMQEPARSYFEREFAKGRTLDEIKTPFDRFLHDLVVEARAQEDASTDESLFLDRALVDSVAYYNFFNLPITDFLHESAMSRPYKKAFLLDLVDFKNDEARNETPEQARQIDQLIEEAYRAYDFDIVRVPVMPVDERVDYILKRV